MSLISGTFFLTSEVFLSNLCFLLRFSESRMSEVHLRRLTRPIFFESETFDVLCSLDMTWNFVFSCKACTVLSFRLKAEASLWRLKLTRITFFNMADRCIFPTGLWQSTFTEIVHRHVLHSWGVMTDMIFLPLWTTLLTLEFVGWNSFFIYTYDQLIYT